MPQYSLILNYAARIIEWCKKNCPIHIATRAPIGQLINKQAKNGVQGTSPWQQHGKSLCIHNAASSDPQHLMIHLNAIRCLLRLLKSPYNNLYFNRDIDYHFLLYSRQIS